MKKTFSNFRTLAALLMAGAAFAACSSDDNIIENQQPANPGEQVYTLTINASKDGGTMRALTLDGSGKLTASWTDGDELTVENMTKDWAALGGTLTASGASGNTATFAGTLTGTIEVGDKLLLTYNNVAFPDFGNQDGTLKGTNGAEKYDVANALVTVASVDDDGDGNKTITISEASASFTTWTAMLKLTLQDGSSNLLNATSLKISVDGIGDLWTFYPTAATYTANGNGILYFALPYADDVAYTKMGATPSDIDEKKATLAAATVTFTATAGGKIYTATKPGYKFTKGKYYAATLTMAETPSLITSPAVGQVIGDDGVNYADAAAATAAGHPAVAKIVYVGSDNGESAPYNHGLALALSDANNGNRCLWKTSRTDAGHTKQTSSSFTSESGLQYNATHNTAEYPAFQKTIANNGTAIPTGCSAWFLPSGYQWKKMITAAGGYSALRDGFTSVGGSNLRSDYYWSSTERNAEKAWYYNFLFSNSWDNHSKDYDMIYVRACLAF